MRRSSWKSSALYPGVSCNTPREVGTDEEVAKEGTPLHSSMEISMVYKGHQKVFQQLQGMEFSMAKEGHWDMLGRLTTWQVLWTVLICPNSPRSPLESPYLASVETHCNGPPSPSRSLRPSAVKPLPPPLPAAPSESYFFLAVSCSPERPLALWG